MRRIAVTAALLVLLVVLPAGRLAAGNWPAWRGENGTGISAEQGVPVRWSSTENVIWKTPLPGAGNSTPIVWNDHIFLTCPIDNGKIRSLLCFNRNTGEKLWQVDVPFETVETHHRDNPFCSGSATTDGKLIYASFGSAGVIACEFDGKTAWQRDLGKLTHVFGQATTPVLYKDSVIISRGPGEPTRLVALEKQTGKTIWEREERGKNSNLFGSWSTPVIAKVGDHDELIISLPEEIKGYDPNTGDELWKCAGLGTEIYTMPALGDGLVVGISGHNGPCLAVRLGGRGDITGSHRLWIAERNQQRVGSGVIYNGYLFVSNATGIAQCIKADTGEQVWEERLGGTLWGSMHVIDGRLYVSNQQGEIFVMQASPEFNLIAKNEMNEHMKAALAPSDGQLFVRTYEHLFCIGKRLMNKPAERTTP